MMKKFKLNQEIEVSYEEAKNFIKNTYVEHEFNIMNVSTISDTVKFECIQNQKYYIKKIGKKGSKIYKGTEYERKVNSGIFVLIMIYDFKHPKNFALNKNNVTREFNVNI